MILRTEVLPYTPVVKETQTSISDLHLSPSTLQTTKVGSYSLQRGSPYLLENQTTRVEDGNGSTYLEEFRCRFTERRTRQMYPGRQGQEVLGGPRTKGKTRNGKPSEKIKGKTRLGFRPITESCPMSPPGMGPTTKQHKSRERYREHHDQSLELVQFEFDQRCQTRSPVDLPVSGLDRGTRSPNPIV